MAESESSNLTQPTPSQEDAPQETNETPVESTVGTGTAMALGCIVGTILLIGFGLIFLFFAAMR